MSSAADQIEVTAAPRFLPVQSEPEAGQFVFAYTMSVANHGNRPVQLLRRYWKITNAEGEVEEVRGDGVVGQQPIIPPGEVFEYTSGAVIETPIGTMEGHYEFRGPADSDNDTDRGDPFLVLIPLFSLRAPNAVH